MRPSAPADAHPEPPISPADAAPLARARAGLSYAPYLHAVEPGLVEHLGGDGFATREAVQAAAALLPGTERVEGDADAIYGVEVGPGVLRLKTTRTGLLSDTVGEVPERGEVVEWSGKSRVRMVRTMCALDWSPVLDAGPGWRPAMVTLTLPGEWEHLAPTGADFKRLLEAFFQRWHRALGRKLAGVWKLEFQRRGAPHVHIYCAVPTGTVVTRTGGNRWRSDIAVELFRDWLSRTWYEIVDSGDERHLRAGTGIDWREGIRASDPKRLGIYFAKRAAAHNVAESKEYQHRVPDLWRGEGNGPGRFWGYRGLDRATEDVELDERDWLELRRLARRWARAQGRPVRSLETGRVAGGFLLLNDAPSWVAQASRWWIGPADGGEPPGRVTGPSDRTGTDRARLGSGALGPAQRVRAPVPPCPGDSIGRQTRRSSAASDPDRKDER